MGNNKRGDAGQGPAGINDELREVIKDAVAEAVVGALTVEMTWEQLKDPETGLPLAAPKLVNEMVFLPAFFCQHIKFHEGAFRGSQETLDKVKNNAAQLRKRVDIMGQSFLTLQEPMVVLERFVGLLVKGGIMDRLDDALGAGLTGPELQKIASGGENAGDNR